jgi:acetolactate synthase I/II/III large subunit
LPADAVQPMIGADAVEVALRAVGVRTVFGLAGAQHTALLDVLDRAGYRIIGNRSESAVIEAADGYARVTGTVGVALVISDQGIVNAVAGVATAAEAGSPVLVLMARPSLSRQDPHAAAHTHTSAVVDPVAKWHATVTRPEQLWETLVAGLDIASSGRPGPVVITVPADFLSADVPDVAASLVRPRRHRIVRSRPAADDIADAAKLLAEAQRPIVVASSGLRASQAEATVAELCQRYQFPLLLEGGARGLLDEDRVQVFSWPFGQTAAAEADVVLLLGCRLGARLGYGRPPRFAANAKFIQVDVVAEEIGRGRSVEVGLVADAGAATADLLAELARVNAGRSDPSWFQNRLVTRQRRIDSVPDASSAGLHPYAIARRLNKLAGPAIYVGDGADSLNWMHGALRLRAGSMWIDHRPLGSMGVGMGLALGACAGEHDRASQNGDDIRPVVLITGDGALGYHVMELETAARARVPLRVLVSNDGAWGTEKHGQLKNIGRHINTQLSVARYELVAEGLGCAGLRAAAADELDAAIGAMMSARGPALVNVIIDPESGALRKADPLLEMIFFDEFSVRKAQQS